jgi:hypothetical protein
MGDEMIPVCEKCHRVAVLIMAGDAESYFHLDDSTPVLGCQREPLKKRER